MRPASGWASERQLQRLEVGNLSLQEIRKALEELYRAGLISSAFNRNILTASGRRELQAIRDAKRRERIRRGAAGPHELALLGDPEVRAAVRRLKQRADRETDQERLTATFVDPGISEQLDNVNNQVIFGRRGTGKTHVLRVVDDVLSACRARWSSISTCGRSGAAASSRTRSGRCTCARRRS